MSGRMNDIVSTDMNNEASLAVISCCNKLQALGCNFVIAVSGADVLVTAVDFDNHGTLHALQAQILDSARRALSNAG